MRSLIIATMCVALAACSSTTKESEVPTWITNPHSVYSDGVYLSGVGQGNTLEQAQQRALANLAKIFSVSLHEKQLDASEFSSETGTTKVEVTRHISSTAQNELQGADVKQHYQGKNGQFYAIAVLEKSGAARKFRESIRDADKQIDTLLPYAANQAPNVFSAMAALQEAHSLQLRRENDNRNLLVVAKQGIPSRHSSAEIKKIFRDAMAQISFATNSDDVFLNEALASAAAGLNMKVDDASPLSLTASIEKQPLLVQQGWIWQRANITLLLTEHDKPTRQQRFSLKVSAKQEGVAEKRLKDKITEQMPNYLFALLSSEN